MRKLLVLAAMCTLYACSDGDKIKLKEDAGTGSRADAGSPGDEGDARTDDDGSDGGSEEDASTSALPRPDDKLERPPTRLPASLKPPRE